ncbi:MAG TPA: diguanylate cyclase [Burkholderiaceae bacterium]|nr:diguanylate cyclase [Burkholderiaceae bacterium]
MDSTQPLHKVATALRSSRILLVDDDTSMIQVLSHILSAYPSQRFALSGADALKLAAVEPPDLVLLDAQMPRMSGFRVCAELKRDPRMADVPIIFVTGHQDEEVESAIFDLGAADFINKPVNPAVVRARVATQLGLRQMALELKRFASTDALTGVANRRCFDETLERECARASDTGQPLSVAMIDIDHFKRYNDCYGYAAGNAALQQVAALLNRGTQRPSDVLARYGGDEFVLLLPDTNGDEAAVVARHLVRVVHDEKLMFSQTDASSYLTISIGISSFEHDGSHARQPDAATILMATSDKALAAAKNAGCAQAWRARLDRQSIEPIDPTKNLVLG